MSDTYSINKEIIHNLFKKILSQSSFKHKQNYESTLRILLRELNDTQIEIITTLLLKEDEYQPVKVGDYIKMEVPKYHKGSEYEEDVMVDMGLMREEELGVCYAEVLDDSSWSTNEEFNPFYSSLKVNLLYHDNKKNLKFYESTVNPMAIKKISKGHIRYFKSLKNITKTNQNA